MSSLFTRLGRFVESRPGTILGITIAVILLASVGAVQTRIVTSEEVFADTSSQTYQDYSAYAATFGADPLIVMIPGTPQELTSPQMLAKIRTLNDALVANPGVKSVVSPLTFLNAAPLPAGVSLDQPGVATSMVLRLRREAERRAGRPLSDRPRVDPDLGQVERRHRRPGQAGR